MEEKGLVKKAKESQHSAWPPRRRKTSEQGGTPPMWLEGMDTWEAVRQRVCQSSQGAGPQLPTTHPSSGLSMV